MSATTEIFYYAHQEPPWLAQNIQALKDTTDGDYELRVLIEPGTAHENLDRCLLRAKSDRVVIMDDDCAILPPDRNWLQQIHKAFDENPRVGQVTPIEIKDPETRDVYVHSPDAFKKWLPNSFRVPWLPGYLIALDRTRVPDIRADVGLPGCTGMSDLDISLQVTWRGFDCLALTGFCAYHPWKSLEAHSTRIDPERDNQQKLYMYAKWGEHFVQAATAQLGMIVTLDNLGLRNPETQETDNG